MGNVESIFPADDFKVAAENAAEEITAGLVFGYDKSGGFVAYGGGLIDGRRPCAKDWLWLLESFKKDLMG